MDLRMLELLSLAVQVGAWLSPAALLYVLSERLRRSTLTPGRKRGFLLLAMPVVWIIGGLLVLRAFDVHAIAWHDRHPAGPITEEDMIALGDAPNVFASWILIGWIPVLFGFVAARRRIELPKTSSTLAPESP